MSPLVNMKAELFYILLLVVLMTPLSAGEHYIQLDSHGLDQRQISRHVSIDHGKQDPAELRVYATDDQLLWLEKQGIDWKELPHPGLNPNVRMGLLERSAIRAWDAFPTYSEYLAMMQNLASSYPGLVRLVDIGDTQLGRELWVLKISDNPNLDEDEPEVFYSSTMHGDETTGYVLLLRLADELASLYGSDPQITHLVDNLEIWINPLANPDGTYAGGNHTVDGATRGLANFWDQNRNFPDPEDGDHPDGHPWAMETIAMMEFAESRNFVLSANFHGGAEVFNYPWDTWDHQHADENWYISLGQAYASRAQADGPQGYFNDLLGGSPFPGVANGYDWYEVNGGRQDYMNYWLGCREITIEISASKNPPGSALPAFWTANRQALLDYLEQALTGVRGIVRNEHGQPLDARVDVPGHDRENSHVYTDALVGDYHRLLSPGVYNFRFSAWGHEALQVDGVALPAGDSTRLDVTLQTAGLYPVHGVVTSPGGVVIGNALIEILETPLDPVTSDSGGTYLTDGLMSGAYVFRVSAAGYASGLFTRTVNADRQRHDFALSPLIYQVWEDFEILNGGLLSGPGQWVWGTPGGNSPSAYSGGKLWATGLAGDYSNDSDWVLSFNDLTVPADYPLLSFRHWYSTEITGGTAYDGGRVELVNAGGSHLLTPQGGYPNSVVAALGSPGYAGASDGWLSADFDLSDYAGQTVDLKWRFASDISVTGPGWFLDDIAVTGSSAVADFTTVSDTHVTGATVQFVDRSTGPIQSWSWDFGDGDTSSEINPGHSYTSTGTYLVTLTVLHAAGPSFTTRALEVVAPQVIFSDGFE